MKNPKVGERVAVYGAYDTPGRVVGTIAHPPHNYLGSYVHVVLDADPKVSRLGRGSITPHIKQCRRLKPKAKRREFWIELGPPKDRVFHVRPYNYEEMLHVREVRKAK